MLLEKLNHYGIRWTIKVWLESYFTPQSQFVEITSNDKMYSTNNYNSTPRNIKYEIPQGPTLGPLLFFIIHK
jgi:hypothetical protein